MVNAHLLGIIAFQPGILANFSLYELDGHLTGDLNDILAVLPVIEPGLRPPADTCIVRIDARNTGNVEAPDNDTQVLQGVYVADVIGGCFKELFFFSFILRGKKDRVTDGKVVQEISDNEILNLTGKGNTTVTQPQRVSHGRASSLSLLKDDSRPYEARPYREADSVS